MDSTFRQGTALQAEKAPTRAASESVALGAGGVAAVLTGTCCVVPLLLVSVGVGGAWLAHLRALAPYRWIFIGVAAIALAFAWKRIYRSAAECKPGEVCAVPAVRRGYRIAFWAVLLLLLFMAVFPYVAPLFY